MLRFPINEIFISIQGEGYFIGKPALFIRFQGCDAGCKFCDTKHAQKIDDEKSTGDVRNIINKKKQSEVYAWVYLDELIELIKTLLPLKKTSSLNHIVLTGGEPLFHDIHVLILRLTNLGYYLQIETSGRYEIPQNSPAWITLSPKKGCLKSSYERCNEIKFIITDNTDFDEISRVSHRRIYLQPESCRGDMIKKAINEAIERNYMVSFQVHKYLNFP